MTDLFLKPEDLRTEMYHSKPRGWINNPQDGVRITHVPTGISAESHGNRSQHANRALALAELSRKLLEQSKMADKEIDEQGVANFSKAMLDKLEVSRNKGRGGWDRPEECTVEQLAVMLIKHIEKGDVLDVANFCMMLHQRGYSKELLKGVFLGYTYSRSGGSDAFEVGLELGKKKGYEDGYKASLKFDPGVAD